MRRLLLSSAARLVARATAAQNMLLVVGSSAGQGGVGAIIGRWPALADGRYDPAGHRAALLTLMVLEIAALIWFMWPRRAASHEPDQGRRGMERLR